MNYSATFRGRARAVQVHSFLKKRQQIIDALPSLEDELVVMVVVENSRMDDD